MVSLAVEELVTRFFTEIRAHVLQVLIVIHLLHVHLMLIWIAEVLFHRLGIESLGLVEVDGIGLSTRWTCCCLGRLSFNCVLILVEVLLLQ